MAPFAPAVLLALLAAAARGAEAARSRSVGGKERPVMKVVRLLQDMGAELQKSLDDDKAVHEQLSCWCSSNDKEKTQAIDLGVQTVAQLQSTMDETTANVLGMKSKRKSTQEDLFADEKALRDATGLRMKENKAFHKEETDLMMAVKASQQAIVALSKHHKNPGLAQLRAAANLLQKAGIADRLTTVARLRAPQLAVLKDFLRDASSALSFLSIPGFQSYRPQSSQIFGILKQMKADFQRSLGEAQGQEAKSKKEFEALRAAKEAEIKSAKRAITEMDQQLAATGEKHAQAAQEFKDTQAQLKLDRTFLAKLKKKCSMSSEEFDQRVKDRMTEISAVQDTIKIINSDEAFDLFSKTFATGLLQTGASRRGAARRQRAAAVLRRAADEGGSAQLGLLAGAAQLDAFVKVRAAIDKMAAELAQQQKDEVKHRDWCKTELQDNRRETAAGEDKQKNLEAKIADLDKTIETLTADVKGTKLAVAKMRQQMQRASEVREAEHADAQQTIQDQRVSQVILEKALTRMKQVYALLELSGQKPGAAHVATSGDKTHPGSGPARFKKYNKNAGGSKVVQMIEEVMKDSRKTEAEAIKSEQDAQSNYEDFMKDSAKSISAASKKFSNLSGALAKAKSSHALAKTDFKQTLQDLAGLNQVSADLHGNCDYILKNFKARQAARAAESEALREAKAILSGMK